MLALDRTFRALVTQLRGFSSSAKMLIASMMIILVLALVLVGMLAGRTEMAPLGLGAGLSDEARTRAVNYLDNRQIPWDEVNGEIQVPVERRYAVLAQLTEQQLITSDQIDFSAIMRDDSPFTDKSTRRARYLVVKMNEVARMVSALSGIEKASVVIDQPDRSGGLGSARIEPTASVMVLTTSDRLPQARADAIARLVAGAHAELKVENVTVVDARTGTALAARSDDDMPATRYLDTKISHERRVKATIEQALSVFPGVVVAVNAQVDATEEVRRSTSYADPKSGVQSEANLEQTTTGRPPRGEAGVRPNAGANLAGQQPEILSTDNRSNSKFTNAFGNTESHRKDSKGYPVKINATVLVPRSYVVGLHRQQANDPEAQPDAATFDTLAAQVRTEIRELVEPLIDTSAAVDALPGTVVVSLFTDMAAAGIGAAGGGSSERGGLAETLVSDHMVTSIGLVGLAVVSLLLMFMMVRRASRQEEMPTAEELVGIPPALAEDDADLVGEADHTVAAMEGVEIDESAVRRQQMLEQINELATDTPQEAAGLLRKWLKDEN
jgi:flagellar M-ring protein FliF